MKTTIPRVLGILFFLFPTLILGLWIYAFTLGNNHPDRLELFAEFFPAFLHGRYALTLFSISSCLLSVLFNAMALNSRERVWKILSVFLIVFSLLLLLLNMFQLL